MRNEHESGPVFLPGMGGRKRLLIDGYNLTGIQHPDLERERDSLLGLLREYRKRTGHEITVVFDGWGGSSSSESRMVLGGLNVIYSRIGEKADTVIKNILQKDAGIILVSSDRELQKAAWAHGSVAVSSGLFAKKLLPDESGDGQEPGEEDEEEYMSPRRAGNPRQPSKRQKALERALKGL